MPTRREQVLQGLFGALQAIPAAEVRRGGELPTRVPPGGVVILRDGAPGEPEVTLSPPVYLYEHRAEVEVIAEPQGEAPDYAAVIDGLIAAVGVALAADTTLGGLCDWVEPEAPETEDLALEGVPGIVAAIIPVVLTYTTTGPLA